MKVLGWLVLAFGRAIEEEERWKSAEVGEKMGSFPSPKMVALVLFGLGAPPKALAMAEEEQSRCERAWQLRRQA